MCSNVHHTPEDIILTLENVMVKDLKLHTSNHFNDDDNINTFYKKSLYSIVMA